MKNTKAFTLVELIVIITILAILGTIGFIGFQNYVGYARDGVRISDISLISRSLKLETAKGNKLPLGEDSVDINSSGTVVMTQGGFSESMAQALKISGSLSDPISGEMYSYSVDTARKKFSVAAILEGAVAQKVSGDEVYALGPEQIAIKGDKLGIIFNEEYIPIEQVGLVGGALDILNTTDEYNVHLDSETIISGTGSSLLAVNPKYSCDRIFQLGGKGAKSGEYHAISPYGEEIPVYCHIDYPEDTFYTTIVDGDLENSNADNWGSYVKTTEDSVSGDNSLMFTGMVNPVKSKNFTYVQAGKEYKLEGKFKSIGTDESKIYFGFVEYDEDFVQIRTNEVRVITGTDTELLHDISSDDTIIKFKNKGDTCEEWAKGAYFSNHSYIAFKTDDSGEYNDLPNRNISDRGGFSSIVTEEEECTLTLNAAVGMNYPSGTKIRRHDSGGTYNYRAASGTYVPFEWTEFSGDVSGISDFGSDKNYFRRGTKFIQILILANYRQGGEAILLVDDLQLVEQ